MSLFGYAAPCWTTLSITPLDPGPPLSRLLLCGAPQSFEHSFLPNKKKKGMSAPKLSLREETATNRKMWTTTRAISRRALMGDQADRPLTPLSSLEQLSSKDSRGNRSTWVDQMARKGPGSHQAFSPLLVVFTDMLRCWLLRLTRLCFT